ncbi:MAG TPA: hypothetical protein DCP92_00835 [Nitrospiraceae bacterium]|nr:hypothetical protein [Nitrospiraceae bacterium]
MTSSDHLAARGIVTGLEFGLSASGSPFYLTTRLMELCVKGSISGCSAGCRVDKLLDEVDP